MDRKFSKMKKITIMSEIDQNIITYNAAIETLQQIGLGIVGAKVEGINYDNLDHTDRNRILSRWRSRIKNNLQLWVADLKAAYPIIMISDQLREKLASIGSAKIGKGKATSEVSDDMISLLEDHLDDPTVVFWFD